eukprot:snap_masked-scaffold1931_size24754-processed-gene-0.5 protein:Tk10804 transcript:snap_masked-scaffold1931_size24754-processed-gene-0.5-mRNA-1 annotation:"dna polymerase epsilon subunit 4-like"
MSGAEVGTESLVHHSETFTETIVPDVEPEIDDDSPGAGESSEKMVQLPLGRVKHIMKMDPDTKMASQEAVFLITKVTELFVQSLARESFSYTSQNKKKTLSKPDVERAIDSVDALAFLEGAMDH